MCQQGQLYRKPLVIRGSNLLLGVLLISALPTVLHAEEPHQSVRLTNGHWPPYMENTPPHYGMISRIVSLAFGKNDRPVTYGFFPWSRAKLLAEKGFWDGSVAWTCRPELLRYFHFSDPIVEHNYVLFYRKDKDFDWAEVEDLESNRIGLTQDYNYGDEFEEAVAAGTISTEVTTSDESNFRKLAAGRIDLFPMEPAVGIEMLKTLNLDDKITFHTTPLQSDYLYLVLSRRVPESERYLEEFNEGLRKLREAGRIEELINTSLPDLPTRYLEVENGDAQCGE
ncbi:transporter substrate-binding domain-containing protein [Marinobacter sp. ATCH36]|uniref:substrate-binding periplasmic protein n=1 Tax=Marinobacter sp. ATCH36 TaxID=2945106 RepID=UPI002020233D|nr:transporter substrate-binding domain-containing protein [Marinobacter sp. ATCH36]MCL7943985.1 transporter substrate-binding domain-containing protein [Marinobacter sp. ATCH36]